MKLKTAWDALLNLIFPPKCVFCGRFMDGREVRVCPGCIKTLPFTEGREVYVSGSFFSVCVAPLFYRGRVRDAFLRYKFSDAEAYCHTFGAMMAKCIAENLEGYDLITWVPISRKRLRKRGYDQSELLAREAAKALGREAIALLVKTADNIQQSTITDENKRKANVLGVYEVPDNRAVAGKTVLLIDDIVTSGATLSECARCLLTAGAEKVVCAAFARR